MTARSVLTPLALAAVLSACGPGHDLNPIRVTPDMIVGEWTCDDGARARFEPDGWLRLDEDGVTHGGRWTNQSWELFLDLNPDEDWRVTTRGREVILLRNDRGMDLGASADCVRVD